MPYDIEELEPRGEVAARAVFNDREYPTKRLLDMALGGLMLIMASPVLLVVAIAIKLESSGPVFFRQTRYGQKKRTFVIYKFRTMSVMEDGAAFRQAMRGDPRITRVGAFLRTTSLDELPQLMNVIKGEMSIVGPRPHPTALDDSHCDIIPNYDMRFNLRPGITGLAQVNGQRGATPTVESMARRISYDLSYLDQVSLSLDGKILLKTLLVPFDNTVF